MKRTVKEILAEREARIAEVKAQYTDEAVKTSSMCANIINADYLTDDMRNRVFAEFCITEEAVELNKIVNAIAAEYDNELYESQVAEGEIVTDENFDDFINSLMKGA